jgi:hypothetical protein
LGEASELTQWQTRLGLPPTEETPSEAELDYIAPRLDELRRTVEGRTILYTSLLLAFLLGLIAHLAGYFIGAGSSNNVVTLLAADVSPDSPQSAT